MNRGQIISEEERICILNWIEQNKTEFTKLTCSRLNRRVTADDLPLIHEIKKRIIDREGLEGFPLEPILGDFIGIVEPGGKIPYHTDPNKGCLIHVRFNLFIQLPKKGGMTYYNYIPIQAQECCYVKSLSGKDVHFSDVNEDTISRIVISYGFLC